MPRAGGRPAGIAPPCHASSRSPAPAAPSAATSSRPRSIAAGGSAPSPATPPASPRRGDALCSSAGASVAPAPGHGWRGYGAVDVPVNRALIDGARAAGVGRVVYVSVLHAPAMRRLAYVAAHERVVAHLRASGLAHAVLRPTGFFSALASYLDLARRGAIPEIGDGLARSNPIADEDLAEVVLDAVADADPALEVAAGGPEVLTRRELAEAAFAALGRPVRIRHVPAGPLPAALALARPFHPRLAQFMRFAVAISTQDLIAPPRGRCRLIDALTARVAGAAAGAHAPRRGA